MQSLYRKGYKYHWCNVIRKYSISNRTQPSDPVQKLFIQKLREYDNKKKEKQSALIDADENTVKMFKNELQRVAKMYGTLSEKELSLFPKVLLKEPSVEPIRMDYK